MIILQIRPNIERALALSLELLITVFTSGRLGGSCVCARDDGIYQLYNRARPGPNPDRQLGVIGTKRKKEKHCEIN